MRGAGDRGGSFGLGLAIVARRGRVPRRHASTLESTHPLEGDVAATARASCVRLPLRRAQTSTTTGSTIGRRCRRS